MDPITIIVTALAAGAAAGLKPTAEQIVKDAYVGIKTFIQRKYAKVNLTPLENKPESEKKRASVAEDLIDVGAINDLELLDQAKALLDVVYRYDTTTAAAIGVNLEEVRAQYLNVRKVVAEGIGINVRKSEFTGGIDIGEVQSGRGDSSPNP
jgi:hypothetical protein